MLEDINVVLFNFFNHSFQNSFFDWLMPIVTGLGEYKFLGLILVAVILYSHLRGKKTLRRISFLALCAFLFSDAIAFVLKHAIHEARPFAVLDNVHLLVTEDDPLSFPSGHSTATLAIVTFLVLNMKELVKKHYHAINACLIIFAVAVMFSRLYVGVHYPGDVLAGALVGIFGAVVVNHFKDYILMIIEKIIGFIYH